MAITGKDWENEFEKLCIAEGVDIVRFYDVTLGYKKVDNPADFVISFSKDYPAILAECKVVDSKKSFSVDFRQLDRLLELKRFRSYVIIWFTKTRHILAVSALEMGRLREAGVKSINPEKMGDIKYIDMNPVYKIVYPKKLEVKNLWKAK